MLAYDFGAGGCTCCCGVALIRVSFSMIIWTVPGQYQKTVFITLVARSMHERSSFWWGDPRLSGSGWESEPSGEDRNWKYSKLQNSVTEHHRYRWQQIYSQEMIAQCSHMHCISYRYICFYIILEQIWENSAFCVDKFREFLKNLWNSEKVSTRRRILTRCSFPYFDKPFILLLIN